jgi:hypothetical protein
MTRLLRARVLAGIVLALAAIGPLNLVSRATSGGPPAGFTNAPGETNCTACHFDFPLNSGTASFSVALPPNLTPSGTHLVSIGFQGSATPRHGFQVTARDGAGLPSGGWAVIQPGITKNAFGSMFHHEHALGGVTLQSWIMNWIAPATLPNGPVTFYACGNEADGSFSPSGDFIYATKAKMFQAVLAGGGTTWPIGTNQYVTLTAPGHGGEIGVVVPSDDPTPVSFGDPFELQVNPATGFFDWALANPLYFQNLVANLDAAGSMTAGVKVPFRAELIGLSLHFAGITADSSFAPTEVSPRFTVTFQ